MTKSIDQIIMKSIYGVHGIRTRGRGKIANSHVNEVQVSLNSSKIKMFTKNILTFFRWKNEGSLALSFLSLHAYVRLAQSSNKFDFS